MPALIELDGIRRSFRGHEVLRGVSLRVDDGEMVAITGPSGAGKSTVLNILGLLEKADSGTYRYAGEPAPRVGSGAAMRMLRTKLGYLFQNYALIDSDTVEANLRVATRYSATRGRRADAMREALHRVGLDGRERERAYSLSGGEQQRLALARLLLKPNEVVLADEPTGSLDPANRDIVLGLLRGMVQSGTAVVIVTHDATVAAACDRVVQLSSEG